MTVLIALMFAIPGLAFGYTAGTFKDFNDVANAMTNGNGWYGKLYCYVLFHCPVS